MDRLFRKDGMISVFLILVLASMIGAMLMFVGAAINQAEQVLCKEYIHLAGRSLLSEYHIPLKERYNLFATDLNLHQQESTMTFYLTENFRKQYTLSLNLDSLKMSLHEFSLGNIDVLEHQILEATTYPPSHNIKETTGAFRPLPLETTGWGILPSKGHSGYSLNLTQLKEYFRGEATNPLNGSALFRLCYIQKYFNHNKRTTFIPNSHFQNEAEYLLYGLPSDDENLRRFQRDFTALRTLLNLAHIKSDPQKMKTLSVAASILTPGPKAVVTQLALAGIWAGFEANNDWKLLVNGEGVEPMKGEEHWALSFDAISKNREAGNYVSPKKESSVGYEKYLNGFLLLQYRETQLLRILDLIQINLCCITKAHFLVQECYTGFSYEITINGVEYVGTEIY